jgi:hypothetical protein
MPRTETIRVSVGSTAAGVIVVPIVAIRIYSNIMAPMFCQIHNTVSTAKKFSKKMRISTIDFSS